MSRCLFPFIIFFLLTELQAGMYVGKLHKLRKDTVLEITTIKGSLPSINQRVDVYTTFETSGLAPENNIGRGHILSANNTRLLIKVVLVYGTWMAPYPEPGQQLLPEHILKLKWQGNGVPIVTEASELERAEEMANFAQYDRATLLLDSLIRVNPVCAKCLGLRGKVAYRQEKFADADSLLSKALGLKPGTYDYYSFRAFSRMKLERKAEAQQDLDSAIFYFPEKERKENLVSLLKQNIQLLSGLNKNDKICQYSGQLKNLVPESFAFRNFDHFQCNPQQLTKPRYYVRGKITYYSTSRLELEILEKGKKYRKSKFLCNLQAGQFLFPEGYLDKAASVPIVKVYKVEGNKIILEIYYWTSTKEFEPNPQPIPIDSEYCFFW